MPKGSPPPKPPGHVFAVKVECVLEHPYGDEPDRCVIEIEVPADHDLDAAMRASVRLTAWYGLKPVRVLQAWKVDGDG